MSGKGCNTGPTLGSQHGASNQSNGIFKGGPCSASIAAHGGNHDRGSGCRSTTYTHGQQVGSKNIPRDVSKELCELFKTLHGNWNQIYSSPEFKIFGLTEKKFENHIRSQLQRVCNKKAANVSVGMTHSSLELQNEITKRKTSLTTPKPVPAKKQRIEDSIDTTVLHVVPLPLSSKGDEFAFQMSLHLLMFKKLLNSISMLRVIQEKVKKKSYKKRNLF
jgi:hypothetical protein